MSDEGGRLSKWKVALAVGVGVVAVVGVSALAYAALSSRRASRAEASNGPRPVPEDEGASEVGSTSAAKKDGEVLTGVKVPKVSCALFAYYEI